MINTQKTKTPIQVADPNMRITNFCEVALGYTLEEAINEANRCLDCKHEPCIKGCPVEIDIPGFIKKVAQGEIKDAYAILSASSLLPAVCGRVCPQETQCEAYCVRGNKGEAVAIGRLERFVADWQMQENVSNTSTISKNGIKVAIVGSGPAGLSCANDLAKLGYDVTVFEALHMLGGVLVYGIPAFRLPRQIVEGEIQRLRDMDVTLKTNVIIGKTLTIDDLFEDGYEAVFLGTGAGLPKFLNIPGEMLNGVYTANEFLTRVNLMKAYDDQAKTPIQIAKRIAVVGGGNVAMDAARAAKRLGAETVYVIYRRSEAELPARLEEVHHAKEEGIIFHVLTNPTAIHGNDQHFVTSITCIKMTLSEPDASGRRKPIPLPNTDHDIEVDSVILALGTTPNPLIKMTTDGLSTDKYGCVTTLDESGQTTIPGVYAGGDVVTGSATVISAMGAGRASAKAIHQYIQDKKIQSGQGGITS